MPERAPPETPTETGASSETPTETEVGENFSQVQEIAKANAIVAIRQTQPSPPLVTTLTDPFCQSPSRLSYL